MIHLIREAFGDPVRWIESKQFNGFSALDLVWMDGKRGMRAVLKHTLDRLDETDCKETA